MGELHSRSPARKRHHFVPEMLQKRFVDEDGWLHAYSRKRSDGAVYRSRPANLFLEGHLYSFEDEQGSKVSSMEEDLGRLEQAADRVISRIVDAARYNERPELERDELITWAAFLAIQWRRVPDLHLTVTTNDEVERSLDALMVELRETQPHLSEELAALDTPENRKRTIKRARVESLARVSGEVMDAIDSRGIAIAVIRQPGKRFIIGGRPVIKLTNPGKTDIRNPECELWLPVASDILVGLGKGRGTETVGPLTPDQVRHFNSGVAKQSTVFASAVAALTRSRARPR